MNTEGREKVIVRTSLIGVLANVILAAFKAVVGLLSGSIAVTLDAVNNLSDALSSIITIIGAKLAGKAPDKKHPLGYGRIEYMSQLIVAAIVLYAGITSMVESVKKIIHPEAAAYSVVSLVIIASAIAVKILLGRYVKKKGEEVNSGSLIASGEDASFDAILSASVLLSAVIYLMTNISLEAFVGAVISVFIIKSGIEMISDAVNEMLGERVKGDLSKEIYETVNQDSAVLGSYDLILHNYGPDRYLGSVHVEVPDTVKADEIDAMTRRLQREVYQKSGVILTSVGIYAKNTKNDAALEVQNRIRNTVMSHEEVLQMHGFYYDAESKDIRFDVILDFEAENRQAVYQKILKEVQNLYPDHHIQITLDADVSDRMG